MAPEAEASADRWILFVEAERPNTTTTSLGDGPQSTLSSAGPRDIPSPTGVGGADVSTQLL